MEESACLLPARRERKRAATRCAWPSVDAVDQLCFLLVVRDSVEPTEQVSDGKKGAKKEARSVPGPGDRGCV